MKEAIVSKLWLGDSIPCHALAAVDKSWIVLCDSHERRMASNVSNMGNSS